MSCLIQAGAFFVVLEKSSFFSNAIQLDAIRFDGLTAVRT